MRRVMECGWIAAAAVVVLVPLALAAKYEPPEPRDVFDELRTAVNRMIDDRVAAETSVLHQDLASAQRSIEDLEQRVALLERKRPDPGEDPDVDPDPGVGDWPRTPRLTAELKTRGPPTGTESILFGEGEWTDEGEWRWAIATRSFQRLPAIQILEQWSGLDATRVSLVFANGYPDAGTIHFNDLRITDDGELVDRVRGKNCILPRGMFVRRYVLGPDADAVRAWEMVEPKGPTLPWIREKCVEGLAINEGAALKLGPYLVGDPGVTDSGSLNGSHGGWKLGPWWFGPEGWQTTCREGYVWAELEMLLTAARSPLAVIDPGTRRFFNPHHPYWAKYQPWRLES